MKASLKLKQELFDYCNDHVEESVAFLKKEMDVMQDAANSETKGSAGDKHETSRAMAHLEKEKIAKQLAEKLNLRQVIAQLRPEKELNVAKLGSLIQTDNGFYYLAIAIGKVSFASLRRPGGKSDIRNEVYFVISPLSPIGRVLIDSKVGDSIVFNRKKIVVQAIC